MDAPLRVALEAIVKRLQLDGFAASLGDDCAYIGIGKIAVVAKILQLQSNEQLHQAIITVGLRFEQDKGPLFLDIVGGFGSSQEDAIIRTMMMWLGGVLPPILPLLGRPMPAEVEVWGRKSEVDILPWTIYAGPYQFLGPQREALARQLVASPPLLQLRSLLNREVEPGQLHWLKLFRCQDDDSDTADCFLDSQQWDAGVKLLLKWKWPRLKGRNWFRQFVVLLPEGLSGSLVQPSHSTDDRLAANPSVKDGVVSLQEWIREAVALCRTHTTDDALFDTLVAADCDPGLAAKLVVFVPLAFYRVMARSSGSAFTDCYIPMDRDGRMLESKKLADEPVYREAVAIAEGEMAHGRDNSSLMAIVQRSPEFQAIRNALRHGAHLENLECTPPALFVDM